MTKDSVVLEEMCVDKETDTDDEGDSVTDEEIVEGDLIVDESEGHDLDSILKYSKYAVNLISESVANELYEEAGKEETEVKNEMSVLPLMRCTLIIIMIKLSIFELISKYFAKWAHLLDF